MQITAADLYPAVRQLLRDRGRTLDWLAHRMGIGQNGDLIAALSGPRPSFPVVLSACTALDISLAELERAMLEVIPCRPS